MKKQIIEIRCQDDYPDQDENNIYIDLSKYEYHYLELVNTSKALRLTGSAPPWCGGEIVYTGKLNMFEDNEPEGLDYVPGLLTEWSQSDPIFLGHRYLFND